MNTNPETLAPVIGAIKSNLDTIKAFMTDKHMTMAEAAQMFLMDNLGYTQIQATEAFTEIENGVDEYTANYEAAAADPNATAASIQQATAAYSPDERHNIYVNVLTTMQLAQTPDADVEELRLANNSLDDNQLVEAIVDSLNGLPFEEILNKIADGVTPELVALVGDSREMRTREFKLTAATIVYAIHKSGNLKLTDDNTEIGPRTIGSMTAAGADAMAATLDRNEGKISLTVWQTILKCVFRALFTVIFAAACTYAIIALNILIAKLIFAVCGIGLFTVMLILPALYYFTKNAIKTGEEEHTKALEKFASLYDRIITKVTAVASAVYAKIKEWAKAVGQTVADKVGQVKETVTRAVNGHHAAAETSSTELALN